MMRTHWICLFSFLVADVARGQHGKAPPRPSRMMGGRRLNFAEMRANEQQGSWRPHGAEEHKQREDDWANLDRKPLSHYKKVTNQVPGSNSALIEDFDLGGLRAQITGGELNVVEWCRQKYPGLKLLKDQGNCSATYQGTMSGQDGTSDIQVVVKIISKEDGIPIANLRDEVLMLYNAQGSDNIVKLYDLYETEKHVVLVMEYCNQGDLCNFLNMMYKDKIAVTAEVKMSITTRLLDILKDIHDKGIIHADIKRGNFVVSGDYTNYAIKLIDFGFAVSSEKLSEDYRGTYLYMAPEISDAKTKQFKKDDTDCFTGGDGQYYPGTVMKTDANGNATQVELYLPNDETKIIKGIKGKPLRPERKYRFNYSKESDIWAAGVEIFELWTHDSFEATILPTENVGSTDACYKALFHVKAEMAKNPNFLLNRLDKYISNRRDKIKQLKFFELEKNYKLANENYKNLKELRVTGNDEDKRTIEAKKAAAKLKRKQAVDALNAAYRECIGPLPKEWPLIRELLGKIFVRKDHRCGDAGELLDFLQKNYKK